MSSARIKLLGSLALLIGACSEPGAGPHVIFISVDTLRADRLGLYGYGRDTSPHLDRFFGQGTVFQNASSSSPCTTPSVAQYLAGAFDHEAERKVLAEHLQAQGWLTAAIVSQQNFYIDLEHYTRGFDHFDIQPRDYTSHDRHTRRSAREVSDLALAWLDDNSDESKLFLWLHYYDPHDPYEPPAGYRGFDEGNRSKKSGDRKRYQDRAKRTGRPAFDAEDVAHLNNLYDGEVLYLDAQIGRVLERLDALGLGERAIVALVADHGEWLGEGGPWGHCISVDDREIRVPLLFRVNGRPLHEQRRETLAASTLDVLPTVLSLLGLAFDPTRYHGVDLTRPPDDRVVVSMWSAELGIRDAEWKLILENNEPSRLYHTGRDPGERINRIHDMPRERDRLAVRAGPYLELKQERGFDQIESALRALGYIDD